MPASTTRALKTSAMRMISSRWVASAFTLISRSSRSIAMSGCTLRTSITSISLSSCLTTCSTEWRVQSTRMVITERSARSVGPTARLSMLKPRRENRPETRDSTPGLFSTSTLSV